MAGKNGFLLVAVLGVGIAGSVGGWVVTDALEADNDFCNACHLPTGAVLHGVIRAGFDALPAHNLAGIHGSAQVGDGGDIRSFRCIDCHGGVGFVGRAKVKVLAAKDALVWLTGDFDEPNHMQVPLNEADCRQCHAKFAEGEMPDFGAVPFHGLAVHNADLGVNCVECHTAHVGGADETSYFLDAPSVREQCGRCHSEFRRE